MSAAADSLGAGSSPAGSGVGFSTPETGRDLIHAAQMDQLRERLGQLEESFTGFGDELKAALPGLPTDESLLAHSRRELASLAMRLCDVAHNDRADWSAKSTVPEDDYIDAQCPSSDAGRRFFGWLMASAM